MARAQYTLDLEAARDDLLLLGQRVETAIGNSVDAVSYTHLTLPTIYSV